MILNLWGGLEFACKSEECHGILPWEDAHTCIYGFAYSSRGVVNPLVY